MKRIVFPIALAGGLLFGLTTLAQTEQELLAQLLEEERNSVEALSLYPEQTRIAILESTKYPELLVKLESLQSKTSQAFKELMDNYPKETQEVVWDLSRYPGLMTALATKDVQSDAALSEVLKDYPDDIHQKTRDLVNTYPALISEVGRLNFQWAGAFDSLVKDYSPTTQQAIRQLVDLPEVLTILTGNLRLAILAGDLYRNYPEWLLQQMDSINLVVAREKAQELEAWKTSMENDPDAKAELEASAQEFANDYGYDDINYDYDDDLYYDEAGGGHVVVEQYYYYHYPYWAGYPYWYDYPRWRPYPYWYDWGFYWGPGHVIIIIDLPSYYFTHWYFGRPVHHYHYSHLSSHFVNHYYGHRTSGSSITSSVRNWRNDNHAVITDDWLSQARTQPEMMKEYGQFETARTNYNVKHADKPAAAPEFLDKNKKRYPALSKEREMAQPQMDKPNPKPEEPTIFRKPVTREPTPPKEPIKRKNEPLTKEKPSVPKVDKAQEYHRNKWEAPKKESKSKTVSPKPPAPKTKTTTPPVKPKTTPSPAPKKKGNGRY